MKNNYCEKHGFYKANICAFCKNEILKNLKKEYEIKLSIEERIKIENNWKYGNI